MIRQKPAINSWSISTCSRTLFLTATPIPRSFSFCVSSCPSRRSIRDVLFHTDLVSDKRLGCFPADLAGGTGTHRAGTRNLTESAREFPRAFTRERPGGLVREARTGSAHGCSASVSLSLLAVCGLRKNYCGTVEIQWPSHLGQQENRAQDAQKGRPCRS